MPTESIRKTLIALLASVWPGSTGMLATRSADWLARYGCVIATAPLFAFDCPPQRLAV